MSIELKYREVEYNFDDLKNQMIEILGESIDLTDFVKKIEDSMLYTIVSNDNFVNNYCEVGLDINKLIEEARKVVGEDAKFLEKDVSIPSFIVHVDEDYNGYVETNVSLKVNENFKGEILKSYLTVEKFIDMLEEDLKITYKNSSWGDLVTMYEEFLEYNFREDYQYLGNQLHAIQSFSEEFVCSYYGGYGDCGAVYVSGFEGLGAMVDMH